MPHFQQVSKKRKATEEVVAAISETDGQTGHSGEPAFKKSTDGEFFSISSWKWSVIYIEFGGVQIWLL